MQPDFERIFHQTYMKRVFKQNVTVSGPSGPMRVYRSRYAERARAEVELEAVTPVTTATAKTTAKPATTSTATAIEEAVEARLKGSASAKRLVFLDALDMELGSPPELCTLLAAPPLFPYPMPQTKEFERFVWEFSIPLSPLFQEIHSDSRTTLRSLRVSCTAHHTLPFKPPLLQVLYPELVWCPVLGASGLVRRPQLSVNPTSAVWSPLHTLLEAVAGLSLCWNDWSVCGTPKYPVLSAESITAFRKHACLEPLTPDRLKAIVDALQAMLCHGNVILLFNCRFSSKRWFL